MDFRHGWIQDFQQCIINVIRFVLSLSFPSPSHISQFCLSLCSFRYLTDSSFCGGETTYIIQAQLPLKETESLFLNSCRVKTTATEFSITDLTWVLGSILNPSLCLMAINILPSKARVTPLPLKPGQDLSQSQKRPEVERDVISQESGDAVSRSGKASHAVPTVRIHQSRDKLPHLCTHPSSLVL